MKYRHIKWIILFLPTVTIGLWEYIRHVFLLPYISMIVGNFLSPVIVFAVTIIFLLRLFKMLEKIQKELELEKLKKAALMERENLARELHDGIAQSLFLLGVKVNKFGRKHQLEEYTDFQNLKQTLQHVHEDVRQSIANLKHSPNEVTFSWTNTIHQFLMELENNHQMDVDFRWGIQEDILSAKEKIELFACIKEAVMNVIKHAKTSKIQILSEETEGGWICLIMDKGKGFKEEDLEKSKGFGLQIIRNRAREMNWIFSIRCIKNKTVLEIRKE
ncbi:sensor histidine kinase [Heyndrickxia acidicola]|uniref:histidine kinase n=1 Tax=Heyndrickxia acidicola TaxID=209389 RepID=A0ABU6MB66_9BACI|nr:histidine kinase [Heyndrickxia acidicola]MED1201925.1 histidine kinase [Heyndrickxia acidicola]